MRKHTHTFMEILENEEENETYIYFIEPVWLNSVSFSSLKLNNEWDGMGVKKNHFRFNVRIKLTCNNTHTHIYPNCKNLHLKGNHLRNLKNLFIYIKFLRFSKTQLLARFKYVLDLLVISNDFLFCFNFLFLKVKFIFDCIIYWLVRI